MFEHILACLDGSPIAERILPLVRSIRPPKGGRLTLLRIVSNTTELGAEEISIRECARQYDARLRFIISLDPAAAILIELDRDPHAIAALTTHGRAAWAEVILGSVALRVIRDLKRPVIVFRPPKEASESPARIATVVLALDGSPLSESMVRHAVKATQALSARLLLHQALRFHIPTAASDPSSESDVIESSFLHRKATEIDATYGAKAQWEVLHGEPADAICRFVSNSRDSCWQ
jgi:nucleotide-binding universal stress UspA family protein